MEAATIFKWDGKSEGDFTTQGTFQIGQLSIKRDKINDWEFFGSVGKGDGKRRKASSSMDLWTSRYESVDQ